MKISRGLALVLAMLMTGSVFIAGCTSTTTTTTAAATASDAPMFLGLLSSHCSTQSREKARQARPVR